MYKANMIQQSTQQGSTIIFLAKRKKWNPKPLDAIFSPFIGYSSTKSTKSTRNKQSQNTQITNHMKKEDLIPIIAHLQDVLNRIAADKHYYMPERKRGLGW